MDLKENKDFELTPDLFEPLDNYKWEIARFNINNEIFSNKEETGILDFYFKSKI